MTTKPARRVLALAVLAAAFGLAACGGGGSEEPASSASDTPSASATAGEKAAWQQQDPCSLLTEEDTKQYLGDAASSVTPKRTDDMGRPRCEWKGSGISEIKLMLWQPPVPDVITDADKTVQVGDATGYITAETSGSCHLDVEAEPAFLQLEVRTSGAGNGQERYCRTVAKTAENVLGELGW